MNRQVIFEEEADYHRWLDTMASCKEKSKFELYAWCLMGNHIHLMIKEVEEPLSLIIKRIGSSFVFWYNKKYDRVGHLFQDRYKSFPVEDDAYFLATLRYIHQNPLRAGLVGATSLDKYPWSSYHEYFGDSFYTDPEIALSLFGHDRSNALKAFSEFHEIVDSDIHSFEHDSRRMTDEHAIQWLKKTFQLKHCSDIQKKSKEEIRACVSHLLDQGMSRRQISRITGLSRNMIEVTVSSC